MARINPPRRASGDYTERERKAAQRGEANSEQRFAVFLAEYCAKREAAAAERADRLDADEPPWH